MDHEKTEANGERRQARIAAARASLRGALADLAKAERATHQTGSRSITGAAIGAEQSECKGHIVGPTSG